MRWQPTCKYQKTPFTGCMVLKRFTICNQLCQSGFIRADPVLFVFIRGLFVEIFFDTTRVYPLEPVTTTSSK
jgi:hypothetical protein